MSLPWSVSPQTAFSLIMPSKIFPDNGLETQSFYHFVHKNLPIVFPKRVVCGDTDHGAEEKGRVGDEVSRKQKLRTSDCGLPTFYP